jgi:hypothetical protein
LFVLLMYLFLYKVQSAHSGVESRLLVSLIIGNLLFCVLTFNDWFDLRNQVVFCNDYKNGSLNLYQVSELVENYRLTNLIVLYLDFTSHMFSKYSLLVYKQFVTLFLDGAKDAYNMLQEWVKTRP